MLKLILPFLCYLILCEPCHARKYSEYSSYETSLLKIIHECRSTIRIYTDEMNDPTISNALMIGAMVRDQKIELYIENSITLESHLDSFVASGIKTFHWSNFKTSLHLIYCGNQAFKFDQSLAESSYAKQAFNINRLKGRHLRLLKNYTQTNFTQISKSKYTPSSSPAFQTNTLQKDRPEGVTSSLPTKPKYLQHKK